MELSSYKIKKFPIFQEIERSFLHFLKRKLFLHFKKGNFFAYRKTETPKIFCLIFQETELSNISFKKVFLTFREKYIQKPRYVQNTVKHL